MTVQIVTESMVQTWVNNQVVQAVESYLQTNAESDIPTIAAACKDIKGNVLTYSQVAWALSYSYRPVLNAVIALPSQDGEIPIVMAMNAVWDR